MIVQMDEHTCQKRQMCMTPFKGDDGCSVSSVCDKQGGKPSKWEEIERRQTKLVAGVYVYCIPLNKHQGICLFSKEPLTKHLNGVVLTLLERKLTSWL